MKIKYGKQIYNIHNMFNKMLNKTFDLINNISQIYFERT